MDVNMKPEILARWERLVGLLMVAKDDGSPRRRQSLLATGAEDIARDLGRSAHFSETAAPTTPVLAPLSLPVPAPALPPPPAPPTTTLEAISVEAPVRPVENSWTGQWVHEHVPDSDDDPEPSFVRVASSYSVDNVGPLTNDQDSDAVDSAINNLPTNDLEPKQEQDEAGNQNPEARAGPEVATGADQELQSPSLELIEDSQPLLGAASPIAIAPMSGSASSTLNLGRLGQNKPMGANEYSSADHSSDDEDNKRISRASFVGDATVFYRQHIQNNFFATLKLCQRCSKANNIERVYKEGSSKKYDPHHVLEQEILGAGHIESSYEADPEEDQVRLEKYFNQAGHFAKPIFSHETLDDEGRLQAPIFPNRYKELSNVERRVIMSPNIGILKAVSLMVPFGAAGVMGGQKILRARVMTKWRHELQEIATSKKMLCGLGEGKERKFHKLARVRGKLPYFIWAERTVVQCCIKNCPYDDISNHEYYFHCSHSSCNMGFPLIHKPGRPRQDVVKPCDACSAEMRDHDHLIALDPNMKETDAKLEQQQRVLIQEAENPTTVGSCPEICQTTICRTCYERILEDGKEAGEIKDITEERRENISKLVESHHKGYDVEDYRVDKYWKYEVKRQEDIDSARNKTVKHPMHHGGVTRDPSLMHFASDSTTPGRMPSMSRMGSIRSRQGSIHDDSGSEADDANESARLVREHHAVHPEVVAEFTKVLDEMHLDRDRADMDRFVIEKKNKYQKLYTLHRAVAEDPDIFFPFLDAYSVNGIPHMHSTGGYSNWLVTLMVLLTQIGVPLTLMAAVTEQYSWSVTKVFDGYDEDTAKAACDEFALDEVNETIFPLGSYRTDLSCSSDPDSTCTEWTCFVDMPSVCDRTNDPRRRFVGFFLVGTLCLASIVKFYSMFRGYTYQGEALVFKLRRNHHQELKTKEELNQEVHAQNATRGLSRKQRTRTWGGWVKARIKGFFEFLVYCICSSASVAEKKEYVHTIAVNLLYPLLAFDDVPDQYVDELIDAVIKYKLPVPYKLSLILEECIPKSGPEQQAAKCTRELRPNHHLSPKAIILSICVNFAVLVITLTASLYVCVQSDSLTELVLNTVALEFLLTLDDNCIDRSKVLLQIKQIAQSAAKQLVYEGVCYSPEPEILKQLSTNEREIDNRKRTRQGITALTKRKKDGFAFTQMTPGLAIISNYNRAIHSPININIFINYPEVYLRTAYQLCYEVFLMDYFRKVHAAYQVQLERVSGTYGKIRRMSVTMPSLSGVLKATSADSLESNLDSAKSAPAFPTAYRHSTGSAGDPLSISNISPKTGNSVAAPERTWFDFFFCCLSDKGIPHFWEVIQHRLIPTIQTFVFFVMWMFSLVYEGMAFLFFLPLKFPIFLACGALYITAYATRCI
jgi:hypothetical protein